MPLVAALKNNITAALFPIREPGGNFTDPAPFALAFADRNFVHNDWDGVVLTSDANTYAAAPYISRRDRKHSGSIVQSASISAGFSCREKMRLLTPALFTELSGMRASCIL